MGRRWRSRSNRSSGASTSWRPSSSTPHSHIAGAGAPPRGAQEHRLAPHEHSRRTGLPDQGRRNQQVGRGAQGLPHRARHASHRRRDRAAARPLASLAAQPGDAHLAELRGRSVIYLANSFPEKALRVHTEAGTIEAAHSTAVGKACLAWLPEDEVRSSTRASRWRASRRRTIDRPRRARLGAGAVREGATRPTGGSRHVGPAAWRLQSVTAAGWWSQQSGSPDRMPGSQTNEEG